MSETGGTTGRSERSRRERARADEPERQPSPKRAFFEGERPCSVLVEFGSQQQLAPAARMYRAPSRDQLQRLANIAGGDPVPVFPIQGSSSVLSPASLMGAGSVSDPLQSYYEIPAASPAEAVELSKKIVRDLKEDVADATPVPLAEPAIGPEYAEAAAAAAPILVPDMRPLQGYLAPGPNGLGFAFSWQFPGGDGRGVTVIDVEGGWRLTHDDLVNARFNQWGGQNRANAAWQDHGTAVVGLLSGSPDNKGITGVCPGARVGMMSVFSEAEGAEQRVAAQILAALQFLKPGDVMLIELQRPGPQTNFQANSDQKGYIPVSYWSDVRTAISRVVQSGVCVVEVGGNGGENLDDEIYDKNFDQATYDSGSIVVGAGAPYGGVFGAPRSRLNFSNYGRRMDCQAWGHQVATCGYGDLWGGEEHPNQAYTGRFLGTSSAAPLVAGVIACLQGRSMVVYGQPLPPLTIRAALNRVGWLQEGTADAPVEQRIGLQPDLVMLYRALQLL